jgi:hypothetical protein
MARPQVAGEEDGRQIWNVAVNIFNKQSLTAENGWSPGLGVGRGVTTPHRKKLACSDMLHKDSEFVGLVETSGSIKSGEFLD